MNGLLTVGYFLFSTIFGLLTLLLWFRILFRYFHISSLNPFSQSVYKLTDLIVAPIANIFKFKNNNYSKFDIPCFIILMIIEVIKYLLVGAMFFASILPLNLLIIYPIADIIIQPLNIMFYAVLIRAIMSWINPGLRNHINALLITITEPLLSSFRRFIPIIAGFDFSPLVVLILLKVITIFISASLPYHLI